MVEQRDGYNSLVVYEAMLEKAIEWIRHKIVYIEGFENSFRLHDCVLLQTIV